MKGKSLSIPESNQSTTQMRIRKNFELQYRKRNYSGSPHAQISADKNGDESGLRVGAVPIVNHSRRRSRQPIPEGDGICRIDRIVTVREWLVGSAGAAGLRCGYDVSAAGTNGLPPNSLSNASIAPTEFLRAVDM